MIVYYNDVTSPYVLCVNAEGRVLRPDSPRGQSFDLDLGLVTLASTSASLHWPRPRPRFIGLDLDLVTLASTLASASTFWPRSRTRCQNFGTAPQHRRLGPGLECSAPASASSIWPHLISLANCLKGSSLDGFDVSYFVLDGVGATDNIISVPNVTEGLRGSVPVTTHTLCISVITDTQPLKAGLTNLFQNYGT